MLSPKKSHLTSTPRRPPIQTPTDSLSGFFGFSMFNELERSHLYLSAFHISVSVFQVFTHHPSILCAPPHTCRPRGATCMGATSSVQISPSQDVGCQKQKVSATNEEVLCLSQSAYPRPILVICFLFPKFRLEVKELCVFHLQLSPFVSCASLHLLCSLGMFPDCLPLCPLGSSCRESFCGARNRAAR